MWLDTQGEELDVTIEYEGHIEPQDTGIEIKVISNSTGEDITDTIEDDEMKPVIEKAFNHLEESYS